jgi:hypothetical protein
MPQQPLTWAETAPVEPIANSTSGIGAVSEWTTTRPERSEATPNTPLHECVWLFAIPMPYNSPNEIKEDVRSFRIYDMPIVSSNGCGNGPG